MTKYQKTWRTLSQEKEKANKQYCNNALKHYAKRTNTSILNNNLAILAGEMFILSTGCLIVWALLVVTN